MTTTPLPAANEPEIITTGRTGLQKFAGWPGPCSQQTAQPLATAPVANATAVPTQATFKIKAEPGLNVTEKKATTRVQPQELQLADDFMDDSAEKTWEAFNAARPDSPLA